MNIDKLAYRKAVNSKIQKATAVLERAKFASEQEPVWGEILPFAGSQKGLELSKTTNGVIFRKIGVYCIIYKPTGEVMGVGQGNITNRWQRHKDTFRAKGVIDENRYSNMARHMYLYDKNVANWQIQICILNDKELSVCYEKELQNLYEPKLNSLSMAGKG
jgi:hypothetical protein|tara:strand:- start:48 stop:530 length:483 start_codon:yes stop_codon:yes gene_type:complete